MSGLDDKGAFRKALDAVFDRQVVRAATDDVVSVVIAGGWVPALHEGRPMCRHPQKSGNLPLPLMKAFEMEIEAEMLRRIQEAAGKAGG